MGVPAEQPLAHPLRSQPVGAAMWPPHPPLSPRTLLAARRLEGRNVIIGCAWKHESASALPRTNADLGGTGDHAGPGPDPHHHTGLDMLTHTTLTNTCTTPCILLGAPLSSMGRLMVTSVCTAARPCPPTRTSPFPAH